MLSLAVCKSKAELPSQIKKRGDPVGLFVLVKELAERTSPCAILKAHARAAARSRAAPEPPQLRCDVRSGVLVGAKFNIQCAERRPGRGRATEVRPFHSDVQPI